MPTDPHELDAPLRDQASGKPLRGVQDFGRFRCGEQPVRLLPTPAAHFITPENARTYKRVSCGAHRPRGSPRHAASSMRKHASCTSILGPFRQNREGPMSLNRKVISYIRTIIRSIFTYRIIFALL